MASQAPGDHLHRLIHSLDRAEKRYFKLYAARHLAAGQGNHVRLFDAIEKMSEYNEKQLLSRFEKEPFVRHFAITKRRLYEAVLHALDAFHAERSLDARLRRSLRQADILHARALYQDAARSLRSVKRLALQHERFTVLLDALDQERRLLERMNYAGVTAKELQALRRATERHLAQLGELNSRWHEKSLVLLGLYTNGAEHTEANTHKVPVAVTEVGSVRAQYLLHHAQSALAYGHYDLEACHAHLCANKELLQTHWGVFRDEPNVLLGVLSNLGHVCVRSGRNKEALQALEELRRVAPDKGGSNSGDFHAKLFVSSMSLELDLHLYLAEFTKAADLLPQLERGLVLHGAALSPLRKAALYLQAAYAYLGNGRPESALRWCNQLLNEPMPEKVADVPVFGRLLNLMVQFDMGKLDLLPYTLRNTERYLRAHGRYQDLEKTFLALFHSLLQKDAVARAQGLVVFLHRTEELQGTSAWRRMLDHFDPVRWARSKFLALLPMRSAHKLATSQLAAQLQNHGMKEEYSRKRGA
jgi:tetratricopeptide (TPR) repeat protein